MEPQNSNQNTTIKIIGCIVVLALAGFAFSKMDNKEEATVGRENEAPVASENQPTTNRKYKDGTYTSPGIYTSPAGEEQVEVTLTLKDDVITSAVFVGKASNPGSVKNQELFKEGFQQLVVGKPIDSIALTVVNGSSLTPKGFNDAVNKIKLQAQA